MRSEIYQCLNQTASAPPPSLPNENLAINTLILEYLRFNNYDHAASVLEVESGMPKENVDVSVIADDIGVKGDGKLPVLYGVVEALKENRANAGRSILQPTGDRVERVAFEEAPNPGSTSAANADSPGASANVNMMKLADPEPFSIGGPV